MGDLIAIAALVVAVIAAVPGFIALHSSRVAGRQADEANEKADESNRLAREANDLVTGRVARETERHDVRWEWDWDTSQPDLARVVNVGRESTAYDVQITLQIDGEVQTMDAPQVAPGESLKLELPGARSSFREEIRQLAQSRKASKEPAPYGRLDTRPLQWPEEVRISNYGFHASNLVVHWSTERGAPKTHESHGQTSLGDHRAFLRRLGV